MNEDKSPKVCPLLKQHCLESSCAWYFFSFLLQYANRFLNVERKP